MKQEFKFELIVVKHHLVSVGTYAHCYTQQHTLSTHKSSDQTHHVTSKMGSQPGELTY